MVGDKILKWHKKKESESEEKSAGSNEEPRDAEKTEKTAGDAKGSDVSSFESESGSKEEVPGKRSQGRLARGCKAKPKTAGGSKEKPATKTEKKSGRTSSKAASGLRANPQVVDFLNSSAVKNETFASEASLQKEVIDKMNGIAKESKEMKNERYEVRCQRDKDPKYIQLRCLQKKCRFSIWFDYRGNAAEPTHLKHARSINLSHVLEEHEGSEQPSSKTSESKSSSKSSEKQPEAKMQTE